MRSQPTIKGAPARQAQPVGFCIMLIQLVLIAATSAEALAQDLYRWVDATGRVQFSDSVPAEYRAVATKIDSRKFKISDEERAQAIARSARERARQAEAERLRSASVQTAVPSPTSTSRKENFPSGTLTEVECKQAWQSFHKSQECFAPFVIYRGVNGAAAAAAGCVSIPAPPPQCHPSSGLPRE